MSDKADVILMQDVSGWREDFPDKKLVFVGSVSAEGYATKGRSEENRADVVGSVERSIITQAAAKGGTLAVVSSPGVSITNNNVGHAFAYALRANVYKTEVPDA